MKFSFIVSNHYAAYYMQLDAYYYLNRWGVCCRKSVKQEMLLLISLEKVTKPDINTKSSQLQNTSQ